MKDKKGFSIIELVMVIAILGILTVVGGSMVIFVTQDLIYSSNVLNMDMLANDAMDKIIYGDSLAKGLLFCQQITASTDNSVTFVDQNGKTVIITLNTGTNKITRTINGSADNNFLYYSSSSNIALTVGRNAKMFTYYDANEAVTTTAASVRRVEINFIAKYKTGNFSNWQGSIESSSSVNTPKYI